jgi:hypothetical protein
MVLRRLAVALLATIPLVLFATASTAVGAGSTASYPPKPPAQETTIAPGVVYGGSAVGATTISACTASPAPQTVAQGAPFLLKVCTFLPGSLVKAYVIPPKAATVLAGGYLADGDGAIVAGPFRLMSPGHYRFSFQGTVSNVAGLGVGGIGTRGMSRVLAAQQKTVQVELDVAGVTGVTLPRTGGSGQGPTSLVWGVVLLGLGCLLVIAAVSRRRGRRTLAAAAHSA